MPGEGSGCPTGSQLGRRELLAFSRPTYDAFDACLNRCDGIVGEATEGPSQSVGPLILTTELLSGGSPCVGDELIDVVYVGNVMERQQSSTATCGKPIHSGIGPETEADWCVVELERP